MFGFRPKLTFGVQQLAPEKSRLSCAPLDSRGRLSPHKTCFLSAFTMSACEF